jgi:hypothetical protein
MIQPETTEKKKGLLDRLPKMGRISQLVLVIGVFLIIFIPLFWLNQQQPEKQAELENTLSNLRKIVSAQQTPRAKWEADLARVTAEAEQAKASFHATTQGPEILDILLELAEENDIYVTSTVMSSAKAAKGSIFPTLTFELGLSGQIPNFQNFLLALDDKLPAAKFKEITFSAPG